MPWLLSLLFALATVFAIPYGNAQVFSSKSEKSDAEVHIQNLREGVLIVPLMKNSKKIQLLEELANDPKVDPSDRKKMMEKLEEEKQKMEDLNTALLTNFTSSFDFCQVLFIENQDLRDFEPSKASFLDPSNMKINSSLKLNNRDYYFLRYFSTTGIATDPEGIRSFYIADSSFTILQHPFPHSPNRQNTYRLRFLDLLNLSPNTNELIQLLTVKLNSNLKRYFIR